MGDVIRYAREGSDGWSRKGKLYHQGLLIVEKHGGERGGNDTTDDFQPPFVVCLVLRSSFLYSTLVLQCFLRMKTGI